MEISIAELAVVLSGANKPSTKTDLGFRIVVLDRGFVYCGYTVIEGDFVTITAVGDKERTRRNCRVWPHVWNRHGHSWGNRRASSRSDFIHQMQPLVLTLDGDGDGYGDGR